MLQRISRISRSARITRGSVRSFISAPELPYIDAQRDQGLGGIYSKQGLDTAWYELVKDSLVQLEAAVELLPNRFSLTNAVDSAKAKGPESQLESLIKTLVTSPDSYAVFNLASRIYNNYMAISSLGHKTGADLASIVAPSAGALYQNPDTSLQFANSPEGYLQLWLEDSFGSLVEFRTLLLNSSLAIKGNGHTWLVARGLSRQDQTNVGSAKFDKLFVVNTYNGGTPNFEYSSGQMQLLNEQLKQLQRDLRGELELQSTIARLPTVEEARYQTSTLDRSFYLPLLLINGSPYLYLPDYGVFGKKQYLENVWGAIDWHAVTARLPNSNERPRF